MASSFQPSAHHHNPVHLDRHALGQCGDADGGAIAIGAECLTDGGGLGYYDCMMQCVNEATVSDWLGDGFCDDGSWGVYFDCDETTEEKLRVCYCGE
mgnify:CR=1 FL=1